MFLLPGSWVGSWEIRDMMRRVGSVRRCRNVRKEQKQKKTVCAERRPRSLWVRLDVHNGDSLLGAHNGENS